MHWLLPDARAHGWHNSAGEPVSLRTLTSTYPKLRRRELNPGLPADSACLSNQPLDNFWWVQPNEHAITLSGSFEWAQINRGWSHESSNKLHKLLFIKPSKSLHRTQRSTGLQVLILGFNLTEACIDTNACSAPTCRNTRRGARTHDHKVKSLALCRLS